MSARIACFLAFLSGACAQSPADLFSQAPPPINDALHSRVNQFYQAQSEGKFRVADQFVAEDSKDIFFEADKRRCRSFKVVRVNWSEKFDHATVLTNCETEMLMPPAGIIKVTMPITTTWRSENGVWFWYAKPANRKESPFGTFTPGEGEGGAVTLPKGPNVEELRRKVTISPENTKVAAASPTTLEFEIASAFPGDLSIVLDRLAASDVTVTLDKTELKSGQTAKLTVAFKPDPNRPRYPRTTEEVWLTVQPLNMRYRARLVFE